MKYRLNSTIFLFIESTSSEYGNLNVGGQVLKVREEYHTLDPKVDAHDFHLKTIGKMIEANENEMRSESSGIYISKSKQIINTARILDEFKKSAFQNELIEVMKKQAA